MNKISMAVKPPEIVPPIPRILVKFATLNNSRIINKIIGTIITQNQEKFFDFLKSKRRLSIRATERAR